MKYVYKIIAAIGALAIIPVLLFTKIFYYDMSSIAVQLLVYIAQATGNNSLDDIIAQNGGNAPTGIADTLSYYDLYDIFAGFAGSGDRTLQETLGGVFTPVVLFAVVSLMVVICAVVTAILAIVVKNNRKVIYSSVVGIGLSVMLSCIFEDIAAPVIEGTVSLSTLLDSMWAGLLGNIDELSLSTNFWFIPAIFGAIILWTVLYNYTLPEKEKRERKLMLGEADDE